MPESVGTVKKTPWANPGPAAGHFDSGMIQKMTDRVEKGMLSSEMGQWVIGSFEMLGAIAGDIAGSAYESRPVKRKDGPLFGPLATFTDDTVLTLAVADALLGDRDYGRALRTYARRHSLRGYGGHFLRWAVASGMGPYNSFGNGSAMRVSPVAWAFDSQDDVLREAARTAECTHNHPEGIKGAQATALAVFLARNGEDKESIRRRVGDRFGYDLSRTVDEIRPGYSFDVTCQGSVPEAIIAFLDSHSYEDALRNAVSLGGDSDTQACIAGAVAEAYYKDIPTEFLRQIRTHLTEDLWDATVRFYRRHGIPAILERIESLDPP
jgi:ADP-ribosylglycohydrolase